MQQPQSPTKKYRFSVSNAEESFKESSLTLTQPDLEQLASFFQQQLVQYFSEVKVEVVNCPDLREHGLISPGLGGNPCLVHVGNLDTIQDSHLESFSLDQISRLVSSSDQLYAFGYAAAAHNVVGCHGDVIANLRIFGERSSYVARTLMESSPVASVNLGSGDMSDNENDDATDGGADGRSSLGTPQPPSPNNPLKSKSPSIGSLHLKAETATIRPPFHDNDNQLDVIDHLPKNSGATRSRSILQRSKTIDTYDSAFSQVICQLERYPSDTFGALASMYVCEGDTNTKVMKISVKNFSDNELNKHNDHNYNFAHVLQTILSEYQKEMSCKNPIGLGGMFHTKGGVEAAVTPRSGVNLNTEASRNIVDVWSTFKPSLCLTTLLSHHSQENVNLEYTSIISDNKRHGGTYLGTLTPDNIEYNGFFHLPKVLYSITHHTNQT